MYSTRSYFRSSLYSFRLYTELLNELYQKKKKKKSPLVFLTNLGTSPGGQQTFSVKDQMVNISGFAAHAVYVAPTQLCCGRTKAPISDM